MKFFDVWRSIAIQNSALKFTLFLLFIISMTSIVLVINTQSKPPVVIERSCESKVLPLSNEKHTEQEIREFIKLALEARFNTKFNQGLHFLSEQEIQKRREEFSSLSQNQIDQTVYPTHLTIESGQASIEGDRLLSHKKVRAATAVVYALHFRKTTRSIENPYGLILTQTELLETKNEKD